MRTYTHEKLTCQSSLSALTAYGPAKTDQIIAEMAFTEEQRAPLSHILEQLDQIHYSPRPDTLKKIQERIHSGHPVGR